MKLVFPSRRLDVLCLGAHTDDIEIGAAATLRRLAQTDHRTRFVFVIMGANRTRREEAQESARSLLDDRVVVRFAGHRDGFLPYEDPAGAKTDLIERTRDISPDLVLVPGLTDGHQDHRFLGALSWQLFRDATIWEYEIPKYESDRPVPNVFVTLDRDEVGAKLDHLERHFLSQHGNRWYSRRVFEATMALRGVEGRSVTGFSEAFVCRKVLLT